MNVPDIDVASDKHEFGYCIIVCLLNEMKYCVISLNFSRAELDFIANSYKHFKIRCLPQVNGLNN
jgi:hypothetical protein